MQSNPDTLELPFLAGVGANGDPVFESLLAEMLPDDPQRVRLLRSPLLARNLAAGDTLRIINLETAEYELERRSGNLCVRVFRKQNIDEINDFLSPRMEKLGGSLDLGEERALVYSIHVSIGFEAIEAVLNLVCQSYPDVVWYYGNVYDPEDGSTPLGWWEEFDNQE
ncbi:MAG: DUF4265 domain-containing protein [Pseudomonadales bacterium]|nr:DUF4265 domain-containing protein [Pseudomonadales bacterium]